MGRTRRAPGHTAGRTRHRTMPAAALLHGVVRGLHGARRDPHRRGLRGFVHDQDAVSETVGEVLLVAMTVVLAAGLAVAIAGQPGPTERVHASLDIATTAGTGGYGTGDETVRIIHRGGQPLQTDDTRIVLTTGGTIERIIGDDLGSAFSDGRFSIGETWTTTRTIAQSSTITIEVVALTVSGPTLVASQDIRIPGACSTDSAAPTVQSWTQSPADVDGGTSGSVTVTVVLTDDCAGVDNTVHPNLLYRLDDGSDPAYTDTGDMTRTAADTWQGSFSATWSNEVGKTLEYQVAGMTDLRGNTAASTVQQDPIQSTTTTHTYADSHTANTGSVTSFTNVQADDGSEATFAEATTGTSTTTKTYTASAVVSAGSWSGGTNTFASDDAYATTTENNPTALRVSLADEGGSPGTISTVTLKAEVSITGWSDDGFTLQACDSTQCSTVSGSLGSNLGADKTISYNVTSLVPGGGSWTLSKINDLQVEINGIKSGGRDGTFRIDHVYAEVAYTNPDHEMDIDVVFTGVPSGVQHILQIEHRVSDEEFRVHMFDGTQFTIVGTLTSTTTTTFEHTLTSGQYNGGAPEIRFTDAATNDPVQGSIAIDFIRIASS